MFCVGVMSYYAHGAFVFMLRHLLEASDMWLTCDVSLSVAVRDCNGLGTLLCDAGVEDTNRSMSA